MIYNWQNDFYLVYWIGSVGALVWVNTKVTLFLKHFAFFDRDVLVYTRRDIEAVITRRSWKPFGRKPTRVRIPFSPPTAICRSQLSGTCSEMTNFIPRRRDSDFKPNAPPPKRQTTSVFFLCLYFALFCISFTPSAGTYDKMLPIFIAGSACDSAIFFHHRIAMFQSFGHLKERLAAPTPKRYTKYTSGFLCRYLQNSLVFFLHLLRLFKSICDSQPTGDFCGWKQT